jgi:hypothetical protein
VEDKKDKRCIYPIHMVGEAKCKPKYGHQKIGEREAKQLYSGGRQQKMITVLVRGYVG